MIRQPLENAIFGITLYYIYPGSDCNQSLLVDLRPRVFEGNGAVEYRMLGSRVGISAEVTHTLELEWNSNLSALQCRLQVTLGHNE